MKSKLKFKLSKAFCGPKMPNLTWALLRAFILFQLTRMGPPSGLERWCGWPGTAWNGCARPPPTTPPPPPPPLPTTTTTSWPGPSPPPPPPPSASWPGACYAVYAFSLISKLKSKLRHFLPNQSLHGCSMGAAAHGSSLMGTSGCSSEQLSVSRYIKHLSICSKFIYDIIFSFLQLAFVEIRRRLRLRGDPWAVPFVSNLCNS